MTNVLPYWNHICVLHNQEKAFLARLAESLKAEDIELTVRYFGLGYPEHMSEYLARADAVLPDLIVSADLEVFEDARLMDKLRPTLHQARDFVPLAESPALTCCERGAALLPILAIPLVYFTREPERAEHTPLSEFDGLCIGGVNNSAIKTVAKTLLSHGGAAQTERFLVQAHVSDMPIGAYNQVRMGAQKTALVPSLYALRADEKQTFLRVPQEGPVLIPSYFAARTSISRDLAQTLAARILCTELCEFYAQNGDLILFPACAQTHSRQERARYFVPRADWLQSYDPQAFGAFYAAHLPGAKV